ncbi:hypothetical protein, partial [Xanthomonas sp. GPE 39]|uniref:hypothetical protein n=1 Tax=Xanthomonas sp. GPE 39 TaxID=1583099 RepID=UPI001F201C29
LMDTSELAIFHGLEMSREPWAYHFRLLVRHHRAERWFHKRPLQVRAWRRFAWRMLDCLTAA